MSSRRMARALRRVWHPKDEADHREACLNKPFMVTVPPKGDTCDTCPVKNLPPELLSRIFEFGGTDSHGTCQVENGNGHVLCDLVGIFPEQIDTGSKGLTVDEFFGSSSSFQINVSLVSRHWYNVAISTPSLWTTITCPSLPYAYPSNTHLSNLLKRSNGLPIVIDLGRGCQPDAYPLLVPHVHRWHSVKAEFHSSESADAFLHAVSHPSISAASRLTTLQLSFRPDEDSRELEQYTLFCGSAPYLERLTLWGVHVDWNQAWISSASNLTYLQLGFHADNARPSWVQFATILRGAPVLTTLKLHISASDLIDWPITSDDGTAAENLMPPIQLLKLMNFSIALRSDCATGLFCVLYMPSLTSLTLNLYDDPNIFIRCLAGPPTSLAPPSPGETPHSLLSQLENLNIVCQFTCLPWIELLYEELQNLKSLSIASHPPSMEPLVLVS